MREVTACRTELLAEIGDHLLGLPHGITGADDLPRRGPRHGSGEEGEPCTRLDDRRVSVAGGREEAGDGDACGHGNSGILGWTGNLPMMWADGRQPHAIYP
jgi:hypothetical protein